MFGSFLLVECTVISIVYVNKVDESRLPFFSEDKGPSDTIPARWSTSTFHVAVQDFLYQKVPKKFIYVGSCIVN